MVTLARVYFDFNISIFKQLIVFLFFQGKILIGTKDNDVIEVGEKNGQLSVLVAGHGEGEVWGLDRHPTAPRFITASYDGTVRIWDIANKVCLT